MNKNLILIAFLVFQSLIFAQEKVDKKLTIEGKTPKVPNSTQASTSTIEFKNSIGNAIITITDEGSNAGSITIPESTPSTTTNKLYNELGTLKFNGSVIGSGGGADSINQLADAKFDGSSLFIGEDSGINDDGTSNANTAIGFNSLYFNTTGSYNTANGFKALSSNATGNYNTSNGYEALRFNTTGSYNTANGSNALYSNTTGASNTANGSYALRSNTTGTFNTANGYFALYFNTTGAGNTANGSYALRSNTTGTFNTANGSQAQYSNTTGSFNTANGYRALRSNTTGDGNVALGYNAGYYETGSNKLYINNHTSSSPLIYGDFTDGSEKVKINGDFEITKKTQIGTSGVPITEIKLLTGSLSTSLYVTEIPYPTGYNQSNTFLVSCKVGPPSGSGAIWDNVGKYGSGDDRSLSVSFSDTQILLYRTDSSTSARDYKMVIMKIE